jgi:hypothetical protein
MGFEPTTPTLASVGSTGQSLLFGVLSAQNGAERFQNSFQLRAYTAPGFLIATDGMCSIPQPLGMMVAIGCH